MKLSLIDLLDLHPSLRLPVEFVGAFTYVDCGARGDRSNSLLSVFSDAKYVGFDPELTIPLGMDTSNVFFPVAVGRSLGMSAFRRTQNPNCSSFFEPDHEFLERFMQVGDFFEVVDIVPLQVVTLDEYLPKNGIPDIDFIELDAQGSELDILKGAEKLLSSRAVGVRIEVEFHQMYNNQPLFSDLDAYLRSFGFMLFDLDRYHLRRKTMPVHGVSREQIVWGQALYFKDWKARTLSKQKLGKLAVAASFFGFHSFAFEILEYLLDSKKGLLTPDEREQLLTIYHSSIPYRGMRLWERFFYFMDRICFRAKALVSQLNRRKNVAIDNSYFWMD